MVIASFFLFFFFSSYKDNLFGPKATHERKYWGFHVFEKALTRLPASQLAFVFSQNLIRSFINNLTSEDRALSKQARHTVSGFETL